MNTDRNLLGPGNRANAAIGRALRLAMRNLGGAYIGVDQATHGSPAKYTLVVPEDEESSPWEPLHVQLGYRPEESTVSVAGIESVINSTAVWWTPGSLAKMLAKTLRSTATSQFFSRGTLTLLMSPAHAGVFAREGWSKRRLREHLWEMGKVPLSDYPPEGNIPQGDWTVDGDRVLICETPDDLRIVVGGGTEGNASHSVFFSRILPVQGRDPEDRMSEGLLAHLRREVEPLVDGWEEAGHAPPEALWETGRRFGLLGMMTPARRGGDPRPWTEIVKVAADLGRVYRPFGFLLTNALIAGYLAEVTDDLGWKRLGLPIVEGRASSVLALNEPDSGNDLASLSTTARSLRGGISADRRQDLHPQRRPGRPPAGGRPAGARIAARHLRGRSPLVGV